MSILSTLLGWLLSSLAMVLAGAPTSGESEATLASQRNLIMVILALSLLFILFGLVRGLRRRREERVKSAFAIFFSVTWLVVAVAAMLTSYT